MSTSPPSWSPPGRSRSRTLPLGVEPTLLPSGGESQGCARAPRAVRRGMPPTSARAGRGALRSRHPTLPPFTWRVSAAFSAPTITRAWRLSQRVCTHRCSAMALAPPAPRASLDRDRAAWAGSQRCGVGASIIVGRAHSRSGPSQPLVPAWRHPAIPRAYRSGSRGSGLAGPGETASVAVDCGPVSRSLTFEECLVALERSARRLGGGLLCRARPAVAITTLLVVVDMLSTSWEPRAWAHSARRT
jgi:hypothetical protein